MSQKKKSVLGDAVKNGPRSTALTGPNAQAPAAGQSPSIAIAPSHEPSDDEWSDEEPDEVLIGYECLGCGHTQDDNGWGGRCNRCEGLALEPMYY